MPKRNRRFEFIAKFERQTWPKKKIPQTSGLSSKYRERPIFCMAIWMRENTSIPSISTSGISPLLPTSMLPLLGMIKCGDPMLAEEGISDFIPVPEYIKADFCLTFKGDSMTGANIYDGDVVFIRKQPDVSSGGDRRRPD